MNFSLTALTATLAGLASASPAANIKLSNLRPNPALSRALLSKATPYKNPARKLEDAIDGSYSLKFSQCVDIKTYDEGNEDYADSIASGVVVPTKSYVIFHVCTDATCGYEGDDDLYIVDLATYLSTVATYHAEKRGKFCEACGQFEDVCNVQEEDDAVEEDEEEAADGEGEEAAEGEQEDAAEGEEEDREEEDREEEDREEEDREEEDREQGEGERKLKKTQRRTSKVAIDCDACQASNCYVQADDAAENLDEQAAEWIKQLAKCQQAQVQVNGADVFFGAMCDDYGDGVELAVFLDDKCSLYTSEVAFNNVYIKEEGNDAYNYLTYAETYIKTAFSDVMSCDNVEYYNAQEEANEEEEVNYEMNEYCKDILEQDSLSYSDCEADEDAEQLVSESGYAYDMAYGDNLDIQEVCAVVKRMENAGEYFNAYDSSTSGTWYKRDKKGQIIVESKGQASGLSGGAIFGIIAAIAAVVGGAAFVVMRKKEKKGETADSAVYQGGALS